MRLVVPNAQDIESQHRQLDKEIRRIERRGPRMTAVDQRTVAELKKTKLALKDQLSVLKRAV
jgi:uncharacterized protein YdcH (DUF465 family)